MSISSDGGETWATSLLGEDILDVLFLDGILYAIIGKTGLLASKDYGQSWDLKFDACKHNVELFIIFK